MRENLLNFLKDIAPKVGVAILIFVIGIIVIKIVLKVMSKALNKSKLDITAHSFLKSLIRVVLYTILIVIVLSKLDVPMTSIVTIIGAAGLAVGLALQASMSNLAGGFIILFSKPFKVGDFVEFGNVSGKVSAISILYTRLLTLDNKAIYIPNGQISSSTLINYTEEPTRRLDLVFSISYDSDFEKAKAILKEIVSENPLALKAPEPIIRVVEYAPNSVNIAVNIWVKSENYGDLHFDLNETVKTKFDEEGIVIPYNHLDVVIKK